MDPFGITILAILGTVATVGLVTDAVQRHRAEKKAAKAKGQRDSNEKFELNTDEIAQLNNLSKDEQQVVNKFLPIIMAADDDFLDKFSNIDRAELEKIAEQGPQSPNVPDAQSLGFPPVQDVTGDIRSETDFAPIEQGAMRQFQEQILPGIKEQFAGVGGLKSSGFQGAAQQGGERLAESLAALRSKFGLERGTALGQLGVKQGALEQQRAASAGQLGNQRFQLGQQGQAQQFGQQLNLANLGLQENSQEMQRRQQGLGAANMILNRGALSTIIPPTPVQSNTTGQLMNLAGQLGGGVLGNTDFSKMIQK